MVLVFDQILQPQIPQKWKSEHVNNELTLTTFTYRHERARDEFCQCDTNAHREGCCLATRVKFANSEEGMVFEPKYVPKNNYEFMMLKLDKKTKRVRIGRFP